LRRQTPARTGKTKLIMVKKLQDQTKDKRSIKK
jgi:hypothetical protein